MSYRTEHDFSRALVTALRKADAWVVCMETGSTGQGVPDLYVVGDVPVWVELKIHHGSVVDLYDGKRKVAYRPGQLAWHRMLWRKTKGRDVACTVVACDDGFMLVVKQDFMDEHLTKDDSVSLVSELKHVVWTLTNWSMR